MLGPRCSGLLVLEPSRILVAQRRQSRYPSHSAHIVRPGRTQSPQAAQTIPSGSGGMNAESSEVLSRHALWRHDCLNATCSSVRTAHFAMCVAERRHSENMRCAQEPEVEAGNLALWLAHDAEIAPCETESLSASETGTLGVERDRLFFFFGFQPAFRCAHG